MSDIAVRLQALDGTWETCGADRAISVNPESEKHSHNEWGADKADFDLHRSPIALWPDLGAFTPVEIEIGGVIVWDGFIGETPLKDGSERVINVQCQGWQYHLDDDVYLRMYVHSKLSDWTDVRSSLGADLSHFVQAGNVASGKGLTIGWQAKTVLVNTTGVGVGLDLGPGQSAKRIVLVFKWNNNTTNGNQKFAIHASDVGIGATGSDLVFETSPGTGEHEQAVAQTLATARRYIWIEAWSAAGGDFTPEGELNLRLTSIAVFADTAFESGNTSILTADMLGRDALERATMLLSSDFSQIGAPNFHIPDFDLSKAFTPREVWEAANAYQNWITKILMGRRFQFSPRPTYPLLEIGAWSGSDIEDASANNGAEIYNRALVEAQGVDGSPLVSARYAGQQPGGLFLAIGSPSPDNPSFATNAASWSASGGGTITRDTEAADYHSSPACGKWVPTGWGQTLSETFTGTFRKGVAYRLTLWVKRSIQLAATFTLGTADDHATQVVELTTAYQLVTIIWAPTQDRTGVTLMLTDTLQPGLGWGGFYVDDLTLTVSEGTLPERRGFQRTKVIQMSSVITAAEGNQIGDIFLQSHMTTPFKGSGAVMPGGVRTVLGGQPVHPSALGLHTQELIRLSHLTDPDTGGIGRDGTIAEVSYTHQDQKAQVVLDDKRANFDALLSRLQVVQGVGS